MKITHNLLTDWLINVLRPLRHKIQHFRDVLQASLVWKNNVPFIWWMLYKELPFPLQHRACMAQKYYYKTNDYNERWQRLLLLSRQSQFFQARWVKVLHPTGHKKRSFRTCSSQPVTWLPQPFYGPFSGTTRVSRCRRELLDFMVQGQINRGRHTDHPAGCHSIRTNFTIPHFLQAGCPSCRPPNSVKALKALG